MQMDNELKNRIHVATMCNDWQQIADRFGVGIEADHFCQAENMDGDQGDRNIGELKRLSEKHAVNILHAPFNELFPAAIDPRARQLAMDRLNRAAEIAIELGISKMIVHSGYVPFVYFKEWHRDRSIEFWREFMADKPANFEICIENVLEDEPYTLVSIVEGLNDPRVGICYDVGHANITGSLGQDKWLDALIPHLKHVHVHNNDGLRDMHGSFMEGTINIESLIERILRETEKDTTITAEVLEGRSSFEWLFEE